MAEPFYNEDEAQEILSAAARRGGSHDRMSKDRLLATAAEMGISPEDVEAAEAEIRERKLARTERQDYVNHTRREFYSSVSQFVGMAVLLGGINILVMGGHFQSIWQFWAIWPLGFMLIHTVKEGWESLVSNTVAGDEEFEQWRAKRRDKAAEKGFVSGADPGDHMSIAIEAIVESRGAKLNAIKIVREKTGLGLKESKDLVDAVEMRGGEPVYPKLPHLPLPELARRALEETQGNKTLAIELVYQRGDGISLSEAMEAVNALDPYRLQH
jgi:ribosomal protein L7/L12